MPHHPEWILFLYIAVPMLAAMLFIIIHQCHLARKERPRLVRETRLMLDTARALAMSREDVRIYVRLIRSRADRLGHDFLTEIGTTTEELDLLCKSHDTPSPSPTDEPVRTESAACAVTTPAGTETQQ